MVIRSMMSFFFFQAEDGIRDSSVTGVQTCALPIYIDLKGSTGTQFEISSWPWRNKADDYQIRDDLSWTKGAHQLKFGFSWAIYKKVQDLFAQTNGGCNFAGTLTGNAFPYLLLDDANPDSEMTAPAPG